MPPTRAAAMITTSGLLADRMRSVWSCLVRSRSLRSARRMSQASWPSRRTIAEPAMPRWPATKTRLPLRSKKFVAGLSTLLCSIEDTGYLARNGLEIGGNHLGHQRRKRDGVTPAQFGARLGRVANQQINLSGSEITWINPHQDTSRGGINALFVN